MSYRFFSSPSSSGQRQISLPGKGKSLFLRIIRGD
ncbi:hypothetical protein ERO13_A01G073266v2 [Gossypium hirsutum]|nr:hypothetical protein ERO13_A01G073266v2 [Gossypium hirsutum]